MSDYNPDEPHDRLTDGMLEQCPGCGIRLGGQPQVARVAKNGVWDADGTHYAGLYDTDPEDGPFYCDRCGRERQARERAAEHDTLDSWGAV